MPAKRLSMRKIKDVLRLCWGQGLSKRKAARSCEVSRPAVDEYLRRAEVAGLCWPLPAGLDDGALERLLFPPHRPCRPGNAACPIGLTSTRGHFRILKSGHFNFLLTHHLNPRSSYIK